MQLTIVSFERHSDTHSFPAGRAKFLLPLRKEKAYSHHYYTNYFTAVARIFTSKMRCGIMK